MPQSFASLNYHLIFSTKHREPMLKDDLRPRLYEYVGGVLRAKGACLMAAGGMPDHVHWLVTLHQQSAVADTLREIKSNSSKWIHETFAHLQGFSWQAGYGAFSVSYSNLSKVKGYLERQAEHHRSTTFQEEFIAFLKRHRMAFDESHLWD